MTGLSQAHAITVAGSNLFVSEWAQVQKIGEYNVSTGAAVNSALVSGPAVEYAGGLLVSGNGLYISSSAIGGTATIGEYGARETRSTCLS